MDFARARSSSNILVELDAADAVTMINDEKENRSIHWCLVKEIKDLARTADREVIFTHASRSQNTLSHTLAAYGQSTPRTAVWFGSGIPEIVNLAMAGRPP